MKILIILTGALGDIARGLPIPSELKKLYPDSHISWVVYPKWKELVKGNLFVDQVIEFEKNTSGFIKTAKCIRDQKYDLVLDLQRNIRSGLFSFLSSAKRRICFNRKNSREINHIFNTEEIPYFPESKSKLFHYLEFIKYLGGEPDKIDFGFNKSLLNYLPVDKEYLVFVIGSTWESKNWFLEKYQELVKLCKSHSIILIGGREQISEAEKIVAENVLNLVGKTSLLEMISVISHAKLVLSPDSGPAHVAAIFNKPVITLLGATAGERVLPYGSEKYAVYENVPCLGCFKKKCPRHDRLCMQMISAEKVYQIIDGIINEK